MVGCIICLGCIICVLTVLKECLLLLLLHFFKVDVDKSIGHMKKLINQLEINVFLVGFAPRSGDSRQCVPSASHCTLQPQVVGKSAPLSHVVHSFLTLRLSHCKE